LVQLDDAYFGGEHSGGKVGRGSENKVPFVAAILVDIALLRGQKSIDDIKMYRYTTLLFKGG
jgi:hypothetical protein